VCTVEERILTLFGISENVLDVLPNAEKTHRDVLSESIV
jgi:hypothetical protein